MIYGVLIHIGNKIKLKFYQCNTILYCIIGNNKAKYLSNSIGNNIKFEMR